MKLEGQNHHPFEGSTWLVGSIFKPQHIQITSPTDMPLVDAVQHHLLTLVGSALKQGSVLLLDPPSDSQTMRHGQREREENVVAGVSRMISSTDRPKPTLTSPVVRDRCRLALGAMIRLWPPKKGQLHRSPVPPEQHGLLFLPNARACPGPEPSVPDRRACVCEDGGPRQSGKRAY